MSEREAEERVKAMMFEFLDEKADGEPQDV
jgi:hypothetical protein